MATSNFYKVNADKYYAVHMNDEDGNYHDIDFEIETERIDQELESRGYESVNSKYAPRRTDDAQFLGELSVSDPEDLFDIGVTVLLRAGYYEGATLDWEMNIIPPMEWEDFSDFMSLSLKDQRDMVYNELLEAGDRGYIDRKHLKQYEQITDGLIEAIESVIERVHRDFGQIAQRTFGLVARASNGEAFYREVQP